MNGIAQRRQALKLTQSQAAEKAEVDIRTWRKWEYGQGAPSRQGLKKLAKALEETEEGAKRILGERPRVEVSKGNRVAGKPRGKGAKAKAAAAEESRGKAIEGPLYRWEETAGSAYRCAADERYILRHYITTQHGIDVWRLRYVYNQETGADMPLRVAETELNRAIAEADEYIQRREKGKP